MDPDHDLRPAPETGAQSPPQDDELRFELQFVVAQLLVDARDLLAEEELPEWAPVSAVAAIEAAWGDPLPASTRRVRHPDVVPIALAALAAVLDEPLFQWDARGRPAAETVAVFDRALDRLGSDASWGSELLAGRAVMGGDGIEPPTPCV